MNWPLPGQDIPTTVNKPSDWVRGRFRAYPPQAKRRWCYSLHRWRALRSTRKPDADV